MTEQLPPVKLQVLELKDPPVDPAVSVKVTVPDGVLDAVVVSATVAVTDAVQLVAPRPMLHETAPTDVEVSSFTTVMELEVPELPLWPGAGLISPP